MTPLERQNPVVSATIRRPIGKTMNGPVLKKKIKKSPPDPRPLRVWLVGPPGGLSSPGGGEVQWIATAQALEQLGLQVQMITTPYTPDDDPKNVVACVPAQRQGGGSASPWVFAQIDPGAMSRNPPPSGTLGKKPDIVHLFGSHRSHLRWIVWARQAGVRVLVSTIGWFSLRAYWRGGTNWPQKFVRAGKFLFRSACPWTPSWRGRLYRSADMLLPNSLAEARQLSRYFGVPPRRIHLVPNGADPRFAQADPALFVQSTGLSGFVFCPGRLEPRKNQLALIRALQGWPKPIVLMGDPVPGQETYVRACRQKAGPNVYFLPRLSHDDPLLASAYAACGCLVLASWFETPGLSALEAAVQGVPLILPEEGACREYFGDLAVYIRPNDLPAIRSAVEKALCAGRNPRLAKWVQTRYTWSQAAKATLQAYTRVLDIPFGYADRRAGQFGTWKDPSPELNPPWDETTGQTNVPQTPLAGVSSL